MLCRVREILREKINYVKKKTVIKFFFKLLIFNVASAVGKEILS